MAIALFACFLVSMTCGKYPVALRDIFSVLSHLIFGTPADYESAVETVVYQVRLPRLLSCVFAGAALSVSGAAYQGVFRNPMVSPDLLGASSGAALGSCIAILCSFPAVLMHLSAFIFGIGAVALTLVISSLVSRRMNSTITLVLTGIVVSALFNAGVSITKSLADTDDKLGEITFWLMGSMTHMRPNSILILIIPVVAGIIPLILCSYRLNLFSFGDEEARTMGINVRNMRILVIICATLATSATVATCGMVGWIGLVIPHFVRMITGPDHKKLIPASVFAGGLFLILVDNISRIFFQVEISVGILTAVIGAPFFLALLIRKRGEWQ